jgi:hypothetical protein
MVRNIKELIPLAEEKRLALPTDEASGQLNRAQQTLRMWACKENGPIRPIRVNGRLAWPVAEIKRLLGICHDGGSNGNPVTAMSSVPLQTTQIDPRKVGRNA